MFQLYSSVEENCFIDPSSAKDWVVHLKKILLLPILVVLVFVISFSNHDVLMTDIW